MGNNNKVLKNHLDGIDFDLENFSPGFQALSMNSIDTIDWVVNITNSARKVLGPSYYISHAPQVQQFYILVSMK